MKSNTRLGRGLGALLKNENVIQPRTEKPSGSGDTDSVSEIHLRSIRPNKFQPRREFARGPLDELKGSIRENGLVQPIYVRKVEDGEYELVSGERRLRAFSELGYEKIPAYVLNVSSDTKMLELALTENLQREDLNAMEIAAGYQRLIDECNLTQEQVAERVGKNRTTVANFLRLLKLPTKIQVSLASGELTVGHARALLGLNHQNEISRLFNRIVKDGLNVRQVEKRVQEILSRAKNESGSAKKVHSSMPSQKEVVLSDLIDKLQKYLGTKVKVMGTGSKTGEIRIEFYSESDLSRLIEIILGDSDE